MNRLQPKTVHREEHFPFRQTRLVPRMHLAHLLKMTHCRPLQDFSIFLEQFTNIPPLHTLFDCRDGSLKERNIIL